MINLRVLVILWSNLPATASAYSIPSAQITTYLPDLLQLYEEEIAKYKVFCWR